LLVDKKGVGGLGGVEVHPGDFQDSGVSWNDLKKWAAETKTGQRPAPRYFWGESCAVS